MFTLLNNTASHFANAAHVDRIGVVPSADPMNTVAAAEVVVTVVEVVEAVEAVEAAEEAFFVAEETADLAVAQEYVEAAAEEDAGFWEQVNADNQAANAADGEDIVGMDVDLAAQVMGMM